MERQQDSFYQAVGVRIKEIRIQKGMSQAELAEKAHLSLPVISSIENAHSKIWLSTFARIAEALNVSADDILRLNTPSAEMRYPEEFDKLLKGCSSAEVEGILKIAKEVKFTLKEQKKEYDY